MPFKESIFSVLIGLCTFLILLISGKIQKYAVMLHAADQQQSLITQYVAATRLDGTVGRDQILGDVIPILTLGKHHN
ncbi:MAG: hypothetical protein BWY95_01743 [Bacteroidetes bacterium ADurb.BinA104]|nr:MAG: hypothetical protein BWY95_01743 [Bacteroidetes bacterium ADurb.BinA104]